jgi:hypothetical protein
MHAAENLLVDIEYVISAYDEKLTWDTTKKALNYALTLEMENQTEYGVWYIETYKNFTWEELACRNSQSSRSPIALGVIEQNKNSPSEISSSKNFS